VKCTNQTFPANAGLTERRSVLLDCGANVGQSLTAFAQGTTPSLDRIIFDGWDVFSFEPNPKLHHRIEKVMDGLAAEYERTSFELVPAGCWWEDGELTFFEGIATHQAGTFASWRRKRAEPCNRWPTGSGPVVKSDGPSLPVIDFPAWVKAHLTKDDLILMKVDIEGAEYKLIEAMEAAGVMDWIDIFYVEWSTQSLTPPVSRRDVNILIRRLEATYGLQVRKWL